MKRQILLIAAVALALACKGSEPEGAAVKKRTGELHVHVETDGDITLDGESITLDSLKKVLAQSKGTVKGVFYTREATDEGNPTPEQWVVFANVQEARIPIRFEGDSQAFAPQAP